MSGKICPQCGKEVAGRKDRIFCSIDCKNNYHNGRISRKTKIKEMTVCKLSKNYDILELVLKSGMGGYPLEQLIKSGFDPELMTSCRKNAQGHLEVHCFDISYCQTPRKIFNVMRNEINPEIFP